MEPEPDRQEPNAQHPCNTPLLVRRLAKMPRRRQQQATHERLETILPEIIKVEILTLDAHPPPTRHVHHRVLTNTTLLETTRL